MIQKQLDILRNRWLQEPSNRANIELQANILRLALKAPVSITQDTFKPSEPFTQSVKEALF